MNSIKVFLGDRAPEIFNKIGILSNVEIVMYIILPLVVFSLFCIILNGMILKKNLDLGMIVLSALICAGIGIVSIEPLNRFVGTTELNYVIERKYMWGLFKDYVDVNQKCLVELLNLKMYLIYVAIFTAGAALVNNMFTDGRIKDSSQGIKAVLGGSILSLVVFLILTTSGIVTVATEYKVNGQTTITDENGKTTDEQEFETKASSEDIKESNSEKNN